MKSQVGLPGNVAHEQTILALARLLCLDGHEVADWYSNDPIAALGGATARQLVTRGHGERVVCFLLDALRAERVPLAQDRASYIPLDNASAPG
jgi:hypothetical protein